MFDSFSYPLNINLTLLTPSGNSFVASFDHTYVRDLLPFPAVPRSKIEERQLAVGFFNVTPTGNTGNGTSSNVFSYADSAGNTFQRKVNAVLNNITLDVQDGSLAPEAQRAFMGVPPMMEALSHARLPGGRVIGV